MLVAACDSSGPPGGLGQGTGGVGGGAPPPTATGGKGATGGAGATGGGAGQAAGGTTADHGGSGAAGPGGAQSPGGGANGTGGAGGTQGPGGGGNGAGGVQSGGGAQSGGGRGGGGSSATGGGPAKPTRLEDWSLTPDGTAPLSLGPWKWDTVEKVHCRFVTAEDGKLRCLPDSPAHLVTYGSFFLDAKCQQPLYGVQADGTVVIRRPWSQPSEQPRAACEPQRYRALRPIPDTTPLFSSIDGITCKPYKPRADRAELPEVMLAADAPERWELGTPGDGQRVSDRLHVAELVTADGARFVDHLVDDRWHMPCGLAAVWPPTSSSPIGLECVPPGAMLTSGALFSDATCVTPASVGVVDRCQTDVAFVQDSNRARLTLGARFVGTLYQAPKGDCSPIIQLDNGPTATMRGYLPGAPLPADAIAAVTEVTAGTGRFRLRGPAGPGNAPVPIRADLYAGSSLTFFDSVANEDCRPAWTPGGKVRCLPASVPIVGERFFSDATCKRLIFYCTGTNCTTRKFAFGRTQSYGRMTVTDAFTGGTPLSTTMGIYYFDGSACSLASLHATDYYEATGAVSWDTFPALPERNPLP
ncbi:MAG TPA: hypothetical protein VHU40_10290 [Polyangia bacterium]|nr:hypothetical protein [Polyangia bacterium]